MKKIFYLIVLSILTSCSSSEDNSSNTNSAFNPPTWIHGTWKGYDNDIPTGLGFIFSTDDFCVIILSQTTCHKELVNQSNGLTTTNEQIDTENYNLTINNNSTSNTYNFRKVSDTEIELVREFTITKYYKQ